MHGYIDKYFFCIRLTLSEPVEGSLKVHGKKDFALFLVFFRLWTHFVILMVVANFL